MPLWEIQRLSLDTSDIWIETLADPLHHVSVLDRR
jgi:hypothetical protein